MACFYCPSLWPMAGVLLYLPLYPTRTKHTAPRMRLYATTYVYATPG